MKISRIINGEKATFNLTMDEMVQAYCEQQAAFDREDIKNAAETIEEHLTPEELEEAVKNYRHKMGDSDEWWMTACSVINQIADNRDCVKSGDGAQCW